MSSRTEMTSAGGLNLESPVIIASGVGRNSGRRSGWKASARLHQGHQPEWRAGNKGVRVGRRPAVC